MISAHLCSFCKTQRKGPIFHLSALPYIQPKEGHLQKKSDNVRFENIL